METINRLLNRLMEIHGVDSDKALAIALSLHPSCISTMRCGHNKMTYGVIVHILDATPQMSIKELRELANTPSKLVGDRSYRNRGTRPV